MAKSRPLAYTFVAWLCPLIAAVHISLFSWIETVAPHLVCTYMTVSETICGGEYWDKRLNVFACAELVLTVSALILSFALFFRGKLSRAAQVGLGLSILVAVALCGLWLYAGLVIGDDGP